MNQMNGDKFTF